MKRRPTWPLRDDIVTHVEVDVVHPQDEFATEFRRRLSQLRTKKQLTQAQLAEKAGLPPATISHFETGFRFPAPLTLQKLAKALEVTMDYLMGGEVPEAPAGPLAEALFRDFNELTEDSQEQLLDMSRLLRAKDERKRGDK